MSAGGRRRRGWIQLARPGEDYHELPAAERQRRVRLYYDRERSGKKKPGRAGPGSGLGT